MAYLVHHGGDVSQCFDEDFVATSAKSVREENKNFVTYIGFDMP